MISYTKGNILHTSNFTNTVNLVGAMGAGLAKQVANAFPDCLAPYRTALRDNSLRQGTVIAWEKPDGGYIFQVPTKRHWRDKSPLDLVEASIDAMLKLALDLGIHTLNTVPLGCGLGGLDWNTQVHPYLKNAAQNYDTLTVAVYQ